MIRKSKKFIRYIGACAQSSLRINRSTRCQLDRINKKMLMACVNNLASYIVMKTKRQISFLFFNAENIYHFGYAIIIGSVLRIYLFLLFLNTVRLFWVRRIFETVLRSIWSRLLEIRERERGGKRKKEWN